LPIREYQCLNKKCENYNIIFEHLHLSVSERLDKCPECGEKKLECLMSSCSAHFKGSGFYAVDYKNTKKPKKVEVEGKTQTITDPKEIRKIRKEQKDAQKKK